MIHDLLVAACVPPFYRYIILSPGDDDPKGNLLARDLMHLRVPGLFPLGEMNVAAKGSGPDRQAQASIQKIDEPVQAVIRGAVALIDQRIRAFDLTHLGILLGQGRYMGVMLPDLRTGSPNIGQEPPRVPVMQIPDCRR